MSLARVCAALFAFLIATVPALASEPEAIHVWLVDSLTKVFPTDAIGKHRLAAPDFWAARNQHVSIQFAIRSAKALKDVSADVTSLRMTAGESLHEVTVRSVGYVVVGSHSDDTPPEELIGEAPGWYPDPLWNFPIELERNRTHSLWVTVAVPANAAPGLYRGTLRVRAGKRTLAGADFRIHVLSATVPAQHTLKVTNWFNLGDKASRQFYDAPQFSDGWWTLVENIAHVMAEHRQNMVITPLMDLITPRVEGVSLAYDFSNFDRWVETLRKAGVIGYIEGSHLLGRAGSYDAALTVPVFLFEKDKVTRQELSPDDPRVEPYLTGFLTALNTHLAEKNWKSIYFQHILDEPHGGEPPYYARMADLVHRNLPGVLTMDAVDASDIPEELKNNTDVWVPQLGRFDNQMPLLRDRIQSGREVWFYTCLFPNKRYLNRLIDYPLVKVRLLHWLNFRYGFTGFLHWGWNYWTPEPVKDTQPVIDANTQLLPPGDAFIVYPDRAGKSVFSSIRLEAMREGIEDYELLRVLQQTNPAAAEQLSQTAIASFTEYVRDPAEFRKIERRLLQALSN
jgi:Glycoside hydrolase 123, catalytic domain/Glycoside hydrolase 123 N-terminal domain